MSTAPPRPIAPGRVGSGVAAEASSAVLARRTARAVAGLFVLIVVLQRFAVPGLPLLALLLPACVIWCIWMLARGLAVIDSHRALLWLAAAAVTVLAIPLQIRFVDGSSTSLTSWGLFLTVWLPFVLILKDRRTTTYVLMLRYVTKVAVALALACIVMFGSQLAGVPYRDWFAAVVPEVLQLQGFVITYPVEYGSEIYRANAWLGLEPSMVSLQLGLGLLAAVLCAAQRRVILVIGLGLVCTISGSGFAIIGVGVLVILLHPAVARLRRYVAPAVVVGLGAAGTSFGAVLLGRVTEIQSDNSSASLRAVEPYEYAWPEWTANLVTLLLGKGPGSSQNLVDDTGILGLLVPSPVKIMFEYGLVAGVVLTAFLLACYFGGPSRAFAVALFVSMWVFQPGTTTIVIVGHLLAFVTLWAPRTGPLLESTRFPPRIATTSAVDRFLWGQPQAVEQR